MKLNFWLVKAAILLTQVRAGISGHVLSMKFYVLRCSPAHLTELLCRAMGLLQLYMWPHTKESWCLSAAIEPSALEMHTSGKGFMFAWADLRSKALQVQPPHVIRSHAKLWSVVNLAVRSALGIPESCLEGRKDLTVGPSLQRQVVFPEEHLPSFCPYQ